VYRMSIWLGAINNYSFKHPIFDYNSHMHRLRWVYETHIMTHSVSHLSPFVLKLRDIHMTSISDFPVALIITCQFHILIHTR
jgi:hypothetical protein